VEGAADLDTAHGDLARLHECNASLALAAGLRCRPIEDTVTDTWAWLQQEGLRVVLEDHPRPGMDTVTERERTINDPSRASVLEGLLQS
jgi:hypothetical protein